MPHLVCFGLGYSATAVARALGARGWQVTGTARTEEGAARIRGLGFEGHVFDGTGPQMAVCAALATATHVLVSAPPAAAGDPVLAHHGGDLADAAMLAALAYFSTIGVYGDHQGRWVDETTPPAPQSLRSRARLEAEQAWSAFGRLHGRPVAILRLAGIYGPGRSAIDELRAGRARRLVKPGQVFNRIHVADIAAATAAAMVGAVDGIYNVTDDEPAPPQDVVAYAAGLLGLPPPPEIPFDTAELSPMARSFYAECKRVRNARLRQDLGIALTCPTFRQGLAQILAESAQ